MRGRRAQSQAREARLTRDLSTERRERAQRNRYYGRTVHSDPSDSERLARGMSPRPERVSPEERARAEPRGRFPTTDRQTADDDPPARRGDKFLRTRTIMVMEHGHVLVVGMGS